MPGSRLVAFEQDAENIQNDLTEQVKQSLYVMDDQQKIYLLQTNDLSEFEITRTIDFSHHNILQDIKALQRSDWVRLHMTERALTIGNKTFNLLNNLSFETKVTNAYFGQETVIEQS